MADSDPLLIKRYASRRLYNTETSDYVTLEDIARFIRAGREVKIVDLKSGDDLTRQYLLQIIAEHEAKGDSVLPIDVLTDLVRSYTGATRSVVPDFLAQSFEMLRGGQAKMLDSMTAMNPLMNTPAFKALRDQQAAIVRAMTGAQEAAAAPEPSPAPKEQGEELDDIKRQLAEMQERLSRMN